MVQIHHPHQLLENYMNEIIKLQEWKAPEILIVKGMIQLQCELLSKSESIVAVETPEQLTAAVALVKELKKVVKDVETERKEIKSPLIALNKNIDSVASEYSEPLADEYKRIEGCVYKYQSKIVEEARAKQAAIDAEEKRKRDEIAAQRMADLAAAKPQEDKILAERRAAAASNAVALEKAKQVVAVPAAPKVAGIVKKRTPHFEVKDIIELAKARPDLVNIEPRTLNINTEILNGMKACPGLDKIWIEESATVRS